MTANPIPPGYHSVTPYLIVDDGAAAMEFYKNAFGAIEIMRMESPDGKLGHGEVKIGDSHVMLADEHAEMGALSPKTIGGAGVSLMIYCENVDEQFQQAIAAGATEKRPVQDQFYGDRTGVLEDPFGHTWSIATHKEDLTPEELDARIQQMMQQQ